MLVKNIMITSAEFLDLKNVVKYLNGDIEESEELLEESNNLLLAVNMVNNSIASSYIELLASKKIMVNTDIVSYSDISEKSIIEIKNVLNGFSQKVGYKILPEGLSLSSKGEMCIEYSYFPDKVSIESDINYYLKLNEMTFAIGVVAEYLYIKGAIDDAYLWDKRFKNSMFNLLRPKRNIVLPARRW